VKNLTVLDHPLIRVCVTALRDKSTPPAAFRRKLSEAAALMVADVTRDLATKTVKVETPLATARGHALKREVILVPVLRAGLAFLDPFLQVLPEAKVGFIGIKRDEATALPRVYSASLPESLAHHDAIVLDPMLATGGSAVEAIRLLRDRGAASVRLVSLVAAPPGVRAVLKAHPGVPVFTAALDPRLNSRYYIVPGLGDAGDRAFRV
jgi:uracil phosphoribosyltransferase